MPPHARPWNRARNGNVSLRAALFICVIGSVVLGDAAYRADALRTQLQTWPRVQAHVDSAAVVASNRVYREAAYAKRLWLTYRHDGRTQVQRVDGNYSGNWANAAHAADAARQQGAVTLLLNPNNSSDITLDPGYTFDFFAGPVVIAAIGLLLLAIGVGAAWSARRSRSAGARSAPRPVKSAPASATFVATVGVLFIGIALAVVIHAAHQRVKWVATPARVDSADVVQREKSKGAGWYYAPRLWIAYERGGRVYHRPVMLGSTWTINQGSVRHQAEVAWHAGPTKAFVNPNDPYQATLDPTSGGNLILPAVFGLAGIGLLALATRRRESERRSTG